jgi:glycosyltransferase domain-containing protein
MRDFTLVIPTYNRSSMLGAFLRYLELEKAECKVLVLDSSKDEHRSVNRAAADKSSLDLRFVEFPVETHPFDKFREGVDAVDTTFCALCADDDLVILPGVARCLEALRADPNASVAQGYSFSFQCRDDGNIDVNNILYFSPTIADSEPLKRVAALFQQYQAATYGNYRTTVLQGILNALQPVSSLLARELLGSAFAAAEGNMIRVPDFSHGRSMDASESYEHWHPLEWFAKDPIGLFNEYGRYRELLKKFVLGQKENTLSAEEVSRILDLIHMRYFAKHAPPDALKFIISQQLLDVEFANYWQRNEIHLPLIEAAGINASEADLRLKRNRSVLRTRSSAHTVKTRHYNLHPNFHSPGAISSPSREMIDAILARMDNYHYRAPASASGSASFFTSASTSQFTPVSTIVDGDFSVSILLCNYNDSRFLPESLQAICDQTHTPDEVIVVDDGSTDNSLEIIEKFAKRYSFIRVLKNEKNRGLLYSIDRAIKEARSEFFVWAAADDLLLPNFLERNVDCLQQNPTAGMTFSRLAVFKDGSKEVTDFTEKNHGIAFDFGTVPKYYSPAALQERLQQSYLWLSANTVVARRSALIQAGGFDPALRWHADYFTFWVVAIRNGACCIPETLALMRQREETYSSTGMSNPVSQRITLGMLGDKLTAKGWRDIGLFYLRCPALLSPFGGAMLSALVRKPRRWPFAITYGRWLANQRQIVPNLKSDVRHRAGRLVAFVKDIIDRVRAIAQAISSKLAD